MLWQHIQIEVVCAAADDIMQLAEAYMHIKFNVCQRLQTTWSFVIFSDEGSQRLQSVLDVLTCNSKPANAVLCKYRGSTNAPCVA